VLFLKQVRKREENPGIPRGEQENNENTVYLSIQDLINDKNLQEYIFEVKLKSKDVVAQFKYVQIKIKAINQD
jgi:hypothetical protein